jgi:hypothetical protein
MKIFTMKTRVILFLLIVCLWGCVSSNATGRALVRTDLADMFENAICKAKTIEKSFKSVKIIEYADNYVIVGKVNDIDVCSNDVERIVIALQNALEEDPAIDRNIGPHIFAYIDDNGKRSVKDTKEVIRSGSLSKCPPIYVSVRKDESNVAVKRNSCPQAAK